MRYALQPPLQKEEFLLTALDWQSNLEPLIPELELETTFRLAIKNHKSAFAINMHDLIAAWREISEIRAARLPTLTELEKQRDEFRKNYRRTALRPEDFMPRM